MDSAKNAGVKTSEFAVLLVYAALGIAVNIGWLTTSQAAAANLAAPSIIADIGTALGVVAYILARSGLKWKWFNNLAQGQQGGASAPTFAPLVDSPPAPSYAPAPGGLPSIPTPSANSMTPPSAANIAQIRSV